MKTIKAGCRDTSSGGGEMRTLKIIGTLLAIWFVTLCFIPREIRAEDDQPDVELTPPRLSFIDGQVSFWREGASDWSQARVNIPLAAGDQLYTGQSGNFEVQIATGSYLRAAGNSQVGVTNLNPESIRFRVSEGHVSLDIRAYDSENDVEVDTPNAAIIVERSGYYRIDVSGESTSVSVHRSGKVTVMPAQADEFAVDAGQTVRLDGVEMPRVAFFQANATDTWDNWCLSRTDTLLNAASVRYVSPDIYGIKDLDQAGEWENVPEYGPVWIPTDIPSGWAPYSSGSWMRDPIYGWTWVDAESWGWAPYHYGRWVFVHGRWAWAPGPPIERPAYAPALVVFFGDTDATDVRREGPIIGWTALGWGEPVIPWWGPARFHRPWWGGWGGPRHVEAERSHKYRNMGVANAVVVVKESNFVHGEVKRIRVPRADMGFGIGPRHTPPAPSGVQGGFLPTTHRGIRPPDTVVKRTVVTTHSPHRRPESESSKKPQFLSPAKTTAPEPRVIHRRDDIPQHEDGFHRETVRSPAHGTKNYSPGNTGYGKQPVHSNETTQQYHPRPLPRNDTVRREQPRVVPEQKPNRVQRPETEIKRHQEAGPGHHVQIRNSGSEKQPSVENRKVFLRGGKPDKGEDKGN